jgi:hypothetical protein
MNSELEGNALDAAVALALGWKHHGAIGTNEPNEDKPWCLSGCNDWWEDPEGHKVCGGCYGIPEKYSTDWALGGPIIERGVNLRYDGGDLRGKWSAKTVNAARDGEVVAFGPTPLIAAMRAFVAARAKP